MLDIQPQVTNGRLYPLTTDFGIVQTYCHRVHLLHFSYAIKYDNEVDDLLLHDELINDNRVQQRHGSSMNQQASHKARVSSKFYGFSTADFSYIAKDNLINYSKCSLEWQYLLGT